MIKSPFGAASTAREVIAGHNLTGKVAIVTGGASGIGVETARAFAEAGADVVIAARNADQAKATIADIDRTAPRKTRWEALELGSFDSIRTFADRWGNKPLHFLINNAGVMACPLTYTQHGLENQIGTNHFGHFLLSMLLLPSLKDGAQKVGAPSRLIELSSTAHRFSDVDFDDMHFRKRDYTPWKGYGQSKTANILFSLGFDDRYKDQGIRAFSVMPGRIFTPLSRHLTLADQVAAGVLDENGNPTHKYFMKDPEQGASTTVWAAVGRELDGAGGLYLEDCAEAPVITETAPEGVMNYALNRQSADRLWAVSLETTGIH